MEYSIEFEKTLFNPHRIDLPQHLILIPQFWDKMYFEQMRLEANTCIEMIQCEFLLFQDYTVICGFLGYPHLFTILEFITDIRQKDIYFLGTAGSTNEIYDHPLPLQVEEIHSTSILDVFAKEKQFKLKTVDSWQMNKAKGVTVDIIQRETPSWLKEQVQKGIDFVEMEIFPLRVYLQKPFHAVVVTSDLLAEPSIRVFKDKKSLQKEFVRSYELILELISKNNGGI